MAPIDINNQEISNITLNGNTDVDTVTVNGQTVFTSGPGLTAEESAIAIYPLSSNLNDITAGASWASDSTDYSFFFNEGSNSSDGPDGNGSQRFDDVENAYSNAFQFINTSSQPFSITFWSKANSRANNFYDLTHLISTDVTSTNREYGGRIKEANFNNYIDVRAPDGTGIYDSGGRVNTPPLGTWYHIATTFNGSNYFLDVSGSGTYTSGNSIAFDEDLLGIGGEFSDYGPRQSGVEAYYRDLRVFDKALSQSEIDSIRNNILSN
jgi:hypothetical protein